MKTTLSTMTDEELADEIDTLVDESSEMEPPADDEAMAGLMKVEARIAVLQAEQRHRNERQIVRSLERIVDRLSH